MRCATSTRLPTCTILDLDDFHIVGSSPEILARLERGTVTVRPIAGTRRRGYTEEEDAAMEAELLADPKEIAEHLMLIDLGRNDVGRIADTGSVELTDKMVVERYSHVMHIVSNVTGTLKQGKSAIDVLRATLPAGTLSGAPKIRAMEIIDELEPVKRGVYGGAVGLYLLGGRHGHRHRHSYCGDQGRSSLSAGGRRCGRRLCPRAGVERDAQQGASDVPRGIHGVVWRR